MLLILKRLFLHSWKKYIVLSILGIVITILYLSFHSFRYLVDYISGLQLSGLVLIMCGGLSFLNYFGAYDIWTYAFSKRKKGEKKPTLHEHSEIKKSNRDKEKLSFGPYLLVGMILLLVSFIPYFWL